LLESVDRGEWKDRRLNIRLSSKDLEAIQKRRRGRVALPDANRELATQVRVRPLTEV